MLTAILEVPDRVPTATRVQQLPPQDHPLSKPHVAKPSRSGQAIDVSAAASTHPSPIVSTWYTPWRSQMLSNDANRSLSICTGHSQGVCVCVRQLSKCLLWCITEPVLACTVYIRAIPKSTRASSALCCRQQRVAFAPHAGTSTSTSKMRKPWHVQRTM